MRAIEVKGRAAGGQVEISENEWARVQQARALLAVCRLRLRDAAAETRPRAGSVQGAAGEGARRRGRERVGHVAAGQAGDIPPRMDERLFERMRKT
jgi:hypothetical protein